MYFLGIWIFVLSAAVELDSTHAENENGMMVMNYTNDFRSLHGCLPLTWDDQLSKDCKKIAMEIHKKSTNKTKKNESPTNQNYTQLKCKFGMQPSALRLCVMKWYVGARLDMYDSGAQEFTAMIWRSSKYMGYGDAMISNAKAIMVVRFSPPGNVEGQYEANVPALIKNDQSGKKKKKERWQINSAVHQANRNSLNLLTVLIYMLLFSYFPN